MNHQTYDSALSLPAQTAAPTKPTCMILVAYHDYAAGQQAMNIFNHLSHRFQCEFEFHCKLWRFDVLEVPSMSELAVRDAVQADLIILSTGDGPELTPAGKDWVEAWASRKLHGESALVLLSNRPHATAPGARSLPVYLREVAQRSGMEFFAYLPGPDDENNSERPRASTSDGGSRSAREPVAAAGGAISVAPDGHMGYSPTVRLG